jgi:NAD(P)-dependent dehydrogenase (short-subunit alcohol dehydrogenase family)
MNGIEGKVIAITGAGGGIGAATAVLLAEHGAKVVLGDLSMASLEAVSARITDAPGRSRLRPGGRDTTRGPGRPRHPGARAVREARRPGQQCRSGTDLPLDELDSRSGDATTPR